MFVSESKFLSAPHDFIPHILASPPNTSALTALIYKPEVEARLLVRLANKARLYGGEIDADGRVVQVSDEELGLRGKIDIREVVGMYRDYVIPLTKDVEVGHSHIYARQRMTLAGGLFSPSIRWGRSSSDRRMDDGEIAFMHQVGRALYNR